MWNSGKIIKDQLHFLLIWNTLKTYSLNLLFSTAEDRSEGNCAREVHDKITGLQDLPINSCQDCHSQSQDQTLYPQDQIYPAANQHPGAFLSTSWTQGAHAQPCAFHQF